MMWGWLAHGDCSNLDGSSSTSLLLCPSSSRVTHFLCKSSWEDKVGERGFTCHPQAETGFCSPLSLKPPLSIWWRENKGSFVSHVKMLTHLSLEWWNITPSADLFTGSSMLLSLPTSSSSSAVTLSSSSTWVHLLQVCSLLLLATERKLGHTYTNTPVTPSK